jgi:type II secretory pathway component PulF
LPLLTRILFFFSDGRVVLAIGAGLVALFFGFGSWVRTPAGRYQFDRLMLEMPRVGRLWRLVAVAHFAQALALQMKVGVSLLEAVPAAGAAAGSPVLEKRLKRSVEALREGCSLEASLECADFFPRAFLATVHAGEEAGNVALTLEWLARMTTVELEAVLEMAAAALEPLMMLAMGIMAALVCLGTLLPMVKLVQNL